MKRKPLLLFTVELLHLAVLVGTCCSQAKAAAPVDTFSLAGTWRFQLDRGDSGIKERWFERALNQKIKLPGSLPAQGVGDEVSLDTKWTGEIQDREWFTNSIYAPYTNAGNFKFPFWLQPAKYYVGTAWYQRDFEIPSNWQGKRVVLSLERPHWETRVWVDSKEIGSNNSLSTPHEYDLGTRLTPGKHRLTIRVDNRVIVDVGVNSHSIADHTQGNWNGIVGNISLRAAAAVWFADLQIYPHVATRSVTIEGRLGNATGKAGEGKIALLINPFDPLREKEAVSTSMPVAWGNQGGAFQAELKLDTQAKVWDEFNPEIYRLMVRLVSKEATDIEEVHFGLREISTQGTQFTLNGRKIFIRGTLECCIFPLTGHPPTDVESWRRIICVCKAHGLNLIRFHSWCPPEAAFVAADELGFYYQVECGSWANQSTTLGDGKPVDQWLYDEADRILKSYGNHPSFLLLPYGNEPGGRDQRAYLAKWVDHYKARDPRRLYTSGSGWPQIAENQFHVAPEPRLQSWGGGLKSRINARPPETRYDYREYIQARTVPVISHEIGQWCVYPNFEEISKYKGYLKPKNFEIFRNTLRAHHMGEQAHDFLIASGKLQTLCYKEDIEAALRTPGMGGFELLDLHDFPGQGTALVGVLDPFWESKGYVTAEEYSRFCNHTVPLARLAKRVFTTDEILEADIEVAHFGSAPFENAAASWKMTGDSGKVVASGKLRAGTIPIGNGTSLGSINLALATLPAPARYQLTVSVETDPTNSLASPVTVLVLENDWDVWVYPRQVGIQSSPGVMVVADLDERAQAALDSGGKVLLMIPPDRVRGDKLGKVVLGFSSIFWNTAWTHRQPPHTLGILCDPRHPALAEFPTESHSNWQWWYLISRAGAMILDGLPRELHPTVQVIDDWVTNRKLGLLFEARMGHGKLLVGSIDLQKDLEQNPVATQMLHSILDYMAGPKFNPSVSLTPAQVQGLMVGEVAPQK